MCSIWLFTMQKLLSKIYTKQKNQFRNYKSVHVEHNVNKAIGEFSLINMQQNYSE